MTQILAVAVCAGIFQIYAAIAYKYFALSVCALCAMMAILGELFTETNISLQKTSFQICLWSSLEMEIVTEQFAQNQIEKMKK